MRSDNIKVELRKKIIRWLISFRRLDPRYKLLNFFNRVAAEGADNIIFDDDSPDVEASKKVGLLEKYAFVFNTTSILTVWRPCSNDAIRKMMEGKGVGKGLDIKGKSARKGKLSGFVPFLQIHKEGDKKEVSEIGMKAKLRVYYSSLEARELVRERMESLVSQLGEDYDDIVSEKDKEMVAHIKLLDKYNSKSLYGLELSQRLFWKGYVIDQDISRDEETETGRPSMAAFQDLNLKTLKVACSSIPKPSPMPVIIQNDRDHAMSPQNLLMAYEENNTVKPVVSDFDGFLSGWRREALWFGCNIPRDQEAVMMWCINNIETILDGDESTDSWTQQWLEQLKRDPAVLPETPEYGYGDPKSYSLIEKVALRMIDTGAVRHGPESFNYIFPQEMDDHFLVISDTFHPVPWRYVNVKELQAILSEKISEGFVFPLNPKWILCDPGWKELYDKLMASDALYADLSKDVWFPPHSGVREKIDSLCKKHPRGFQQHTNFIQRRREGYRLAPLRQSIQQGLALSAKSKVELAELELENFAPLEETSKESLMPTEFQRQTSAIHGNLFEVKNEGFVSDKYTVVEHLRKGRSGLVSKVKLRKSKMAGSAIKTQGKLQRFSTYGTRKLTKHTRQKMYYARKTIDLDRIESRDAIENLKKDLSVWNSLDHPNIVRLHEVYMIKSELHMVMDYCVDTIDRRPPKTEKEVANIMKQVVSGLKYIHERGVFHQDLNINNIAYDTSQDASIQLISFGLSKKYFSANGILDRVEDMSCMAPEVIQGKQFTAKSDTWSLGVVMYELLSRTKPFVGQKNILKEKILRGEYKAMNGKVWQEISHDAKDMIRSLLVVDPDKRLDATGAINHDWIKNYEASTRLSLSVEEQKHIGDTLKKYTEAPAIKKVALSVIAHRSTMQDIFKLRQLFQVYDRNNDGVISLEELKFGLKKSDYSESEIEDIFESIDLQKTGNIMYTEFLGATLLERGNIEEERITDAFDKLDVDKTGYITRENLKQALNPCSNLENVIDDIMDETKKGKISYNKFRKCFRSKTSEMAFEMLSSKESSHEISHMELGSSIKE